MRGRGSAGALGVWCLVRAAGVPKLGRSAGREARGLMRWAGVQDVGLGAVSELRVQKENCLSLSHLVTWIEPGAPKKRSGRGHSVAAFGVSDSGVPMGDYVLSSVRMSRHRLNSHSIWAKV